MIDDKSIHFDYEIRDFKIIDDLIVVLLSIPYDQNVLDNIWTVSFEGKIMWQVESISKKFELKNPMSYENLIVSDNGELAASDFYGRKYYINPKNGNILKEEINQW